MKYKIAVVDDDQIILKMVVQSLESCGYIVHAVKDGKDAVKMIPEINPDLAILDWNLPGMNGLQICQFLRSYPKTSKIPILMLTVFGEMNQKVSAFETGADDYLIKPFEIEELLARVKALLRRSGGEQNKTSEVIKAGALQIDVLSHKTFVDGKELDLRPKEFELLYVLLKSPKRMLTRQYLIERVWGYNSKVVTTRTIDSHMARLREKLGPKVSKMIQTIPGFGYILESGDSK